MENIEPFLRTKFEFPCGKGMKYQAEWMDVIKQHRRAPYLYSMEIAYDYINLFAFDSGEEIEQIIQEKYQDTDEKWLIFTDSIERGKKFRSELLKGECSVCAEDVVFIDADYDKDEEAFRSVTQVSESKYIDKRIVIATAVMDNGVSFHDTALRNMVIFADTKEEFIQMLGRKRTDGKTINLYVCRRDREHFRKRFVAAKEILKIYEQYEKDLARIWGVCENPYNYMSNFLYYNNCNNYNIFFQNRILIMVS